MNHRHVRRVSSVGWKKSCNITTNWKTNLRWVAFFLITLYVYQVGDNDVNEDERTHWGDQREAKPPISLRGKREGVKTSKKKLVQGENITNGTVKETEIKCGEINLRRLLRTIHFIFYCYAFAGVYNKLCRYERNGGTVFVVRYLSPELSVFGVWRKHMTQATQKKGRMNVRLEQRRNEDRFKRENRMEKEERDKEGEEV